MGGWSARVAASWIFAVASAAAIVAAAGDRSLLQTRVEIACDQTTDPEIQKYCEDAEDQAEADGVEFERGKTRVIVTIPGGAPANNNNGETSVSIDAPPPPFRAPPSVPTQLYPRDVTQQPTPSPELPSPSPQPPPPPSPQSQPPPAGDEDDGGGGGHEEINKVIDNYRSAGFNVPTVVNIPGVGQVTIDPPEEPAPQEPDPTSIPKDPPPIPEAPEPQGPPPSPPPVPEAPSPQAAGGAPEPWKSPPPSPPPPPVQAQKLAPASPPTPPPQSSPESQPASSPATPPGPLPTPPPAPEPSAPPPVPAKKTPSRNKKRKNKKAAKKAREEQEAQEAEREAAQQAAKETSQEDVEEATQGGDAVGGGGCIPLLNEVGQQSHLAAFSIALTNTGIYDVIEGLDQNVTVLAPTDVAFEELANARSTTLLELVQDVEYMSEVLRLHILKGQVAYTDLSNSMTLPTLLPGTSLLVSTTESDYLLVSPGGQPATIQLANIFACGAVMHQIDRVLLPAERLSIELTA